MPYRDKVYQQLVTADQSEIKVHSSIISDKIEAILLSRALFVLEALRTYSSVFFDEDVEIFLRWEECKERFSMNSLFGSNIIY